MKRTDQIKNSISEGQNTSEWAQTVNIKGESHFQQEEIQPVNKPTSCKILFSAIVLFLLTLPFMHSFAQEETTFVKLTDQVPDFAFEMKPGIKQNIAELKGKLVMITFFATWCAPCRQELPHIQSDIYNKYKNNPKFQLLIFGREHSWEEVDKFKAENRFSMPFLPDPDRKIYSKFAGQYIPRNFLISPEGKVLFSSIGFADKDFRELKKMLETLLKKK
jgi:thiol-disulfide isomerase/thioredoxin